MAVPLGVAALVSASIRLFGDASGELPEREFLNELGWPWVPLCAIGMFGVLMAARGRRLVAMFSLVPFWATVTGAIALGIAGMSKATTICGPASRETVALGSLGEIYGTYVLAFAWSAALSLFVAVSTWMDGRRGEKGPAASLLLAGLSFVAAALQAGALRATIFIAVSSSRLESLGPRSLQVSHWGVLAAALMFGSLLVAGAAAPRFASSPRRVGVLCALIVVPLMSWAVALGSRTPILDFIQERLPLARPVESVTEVLASPQFDGRTNQGWSAVLGARAGSEELKHLLRAAWRAGAVSVELAGSAGSLSQPLPLEGLERRVAFAPVVTTIRLRGAGRREACAVSVTRVEAGLLAQKADGSKALWTPASVEGEWAPRLVPGADFVGSFPSDAELIEASLLANAHGHVLVLTVE